MGTSKPELPLAAELEPRPRSSGAACAADQQPLRVEPRRSKASATAWATSRDQFQIPSQRKNSLARPDSPRSRGWAGRRAGARLPRRSSLREG